MPTGGPIRGRGSAGRLIMRRGGRHRGGAAGRGGSMSRGVARGQELIAFIRGNETLTIVSVILNINYPSKI